MGFRRNNEPVTLATIRLFLTMGDDLVGQGRMTQEVIDSFSSRGALIDDAEIVEDLTRVSTTMILGLLVTARSYLLGCASSMRSSLASKPPGSSLPSGTPLSSKHKFLSSAVESRSRVEDFALEGRIDPTTVF